MKLGEYSAKLRGKGVHIPKAMELNGKELNVFVLRQEEITYLALWEPEELTPEEQEFMKDGSLEILQQYTASCRKDGNFRLPDVFLEGLEDDHVLVVGVLDHVEIFSGKYPQEEDTDDVMAEIMELLGLDI